MSELGAAIDFLAGSESGRFSQLPAMRTMIVSEDLLPSIISSVFVPAERETYLFVQNDPVDKYDYLGMACSVPSSASDCKCPNGSHKGKRQKPGYVKTPNGCSNPVFPPPFKDNPSGIPGCSFKGACDNHDCCYGRCNSSKTGCDAAFYGRMLGKCLLCAGWNPILLMQCNNWAGIYVAAVVRGGGSAYNDNQSQACEECCCP